MKGESLMKFGENLKLIRKSKHISQEELAEKLGISRQSVSKWETGENYPSMANILCLCDIFKCKINELVKDDFIDINSLDEEIKMSVVKFKEKEQKRMKGLSKAIYIVARIFKIVGIIGFVFSIILLISSIIVVPNVKFDPPNNVVKIFDNEYSYKYEDNKLYFGDEDVEFTPLVKQEFDKFISKSSFYHTSFAFIMCIGLMSSCFFLFKMLGYLEKIFVNIHDNDTPFSSDNVEFIKKIALYLALYVFVPDVLGTLTGIIFDLNLSVEIDMINYLFVLIVLAIAYIFKYGYEIQLDSKGKIYGDFNE